jgi:hypothetical protein
LPPVCTITTNRVKHFYSIKETTKRFNWLFIHFADLLTAAFDFPLGIVGNEGLMCLCRLVPFFFLRLIMKWFKYFDLIAQLCVRSFRNAYVSAAISALYSWSFVKITYRFAAAIASSKRSFSNPMADRVFSWALYVSGFSLYSYSILFLSRSEIHELTSHPRTPTRIVLTEADAMTCCMKSVTIRGGLRKS